MKSVIPLLIVIISIAYPPQSFSGAKEYKDLFSLIKKINTQDQLVVMQIEKLAGLVLERQESEFGNPIRYYKTDKSHPCWIRSIREDSYGLLISLGGCKCITDKMVENEFGTDAEGDAHGAQLSLTYSGRLRNITFIFENRCLRNVMFDKVKDK